MRTFLATKKLESALALFLAGGVAIFLINALFAHPWTDDYIYSAISRDKGFADSFIFWFNNVTGRYFSTSLLLVNPMVYGQLWGYKLLPFLLYTTLFGTLIFVLEEITTGHLSLQQSFLFVLALLFVYLDQMPDIRSGIYWMTGTITYLAGTILLFLLLMVMIRILKRGEDGGSLLTWSGVVLGLCLPGTNEIILAVLIPMVVFFLFLDYRQGHIVNRHLLLILAAVLLGSCFALLAPGNAVRLGSYPGSRNILQSMIQSGAATLSSLKLWLGTPHVMVLTLLVAMATRRMPSLQGLGRGVHPVISSALLLLFIFGCYFPPYWSMGINPPDRVVNLIYLLFLVVWLFNVVVITVRFDPRVFDVIGGLRMAFVVPLLVAYTLFLLSLGHSNLVMVAGDLVSGRSYRFDRELRQRYAQIKADPKPDCEVDVLKYVPKSLFFSDIYFVNRDWINQSYADYYGKSSIILRRIRSVQ
ncbi:hypothetical protein AOG1_23730 [Geobacter sp. AOG1]|nr:hypothetical protein AOG1_23730 [Geobacter sp. AOG1]